MRKALFGILMATALTVPALAQEGEMPESYRRQAERNQANSDRQAAREAARSEQRVERQSAEPRFERREQRQEQRAQQQQVDVQTQQHVRRERGERDRAQRVYPDDMPESYRRQGDRNQRAVQQQERRERFERRGDRRDRNNDRRWSDNRRDWDNDRRWGDDDRSWGSNRNRWDRGWRQDSRYDWQRYRYSNRGIFRQSPYYSPYRNYGYNRFSIGITLGRDYYSNRYWINDPWQYRLPQPYAGTRWVRYYNDVLLVDVFDGQVLDVIHDFFW